MYVKAGINQENISESTIVNEKIFESFFIKTTTLQKDMVYGKVSKYEYFKPWF